MPHEVDPAELIAEAGARLDRGVEIGLIQNIGFERIGVKQAVAPILEAIGPYPHAEISKTARPKQGTRLLKLQCPTCPYTVRITRKWLDKVGPPACPEHGDSMREA
jgi:hypothetical protein